MRLDMTGPLAFKGQTGESAPTTTSAGDICAKNWVMFDTNDHAVAVTLETAWNTPQQHDRWLPHRGSAVGPGHRALFPHRKRGGIAFVAREVFDHHAD